MVLSCVGRASSRQDARCEVPSDWLDGEQGDLELDVPTVPPGFMREVVLEQCYSQPLAPRSRTVYYHYFEVVPNALPGSPVVRRTALLTEDMVEGFLRSSKGLRKAGLQLANFAFGLPSIVPVQSTARAVTRSRTAQEAEQPAQSTAQAAAKKHVGNNSTTLLGRQPQPAATPETSAVRPAYGLRSRNRHLSGTTFYLPNTWKPADERSLLNRLRPRNQLGLTQFGVGGAASTEAFRSFHTERPQWFISDASLRTLSPVFHRWASRGWAEERGLD